MNSDLYAILGVTKSATQAELKEAYVRLSKALHPDVNPHGATLMQAVNEAYETLSDAKKRAQYDRGEKVRSFPVREATVHNDGSVNLIAIARKFISPDLQGSVLPVLERALSESGIDARAATVEQALTAAGVFKKKKKGARKTA